MKTMLCAMVIGALLAGAGCVRTVNERTTAGVPFVKDRFEDRYERPVDQILQASKEVISELGALVSEGTLYGETNPVKFVEGKVNQRSVWVRIQAVDPKVTAVTVQTRTSGGGTDMDLAHTIGTQIALKLK